MKMANPFYARYIPASTSLSKTAPLPTVEESHPSKRRKTKSGFNFITTPISEKPRVQDGLRGHVADLDQNLESIAKAKPKKKKKHAKFSGTLCSPAGLEIPLDGHDAPSNTILGDRNVESAGKNHSESQKDGKTKTNSKKSKSLPASEKAVQDNDSPVLHDSTHAEKVKHKSIIAKFEKSTRVSAETTEKVLSSMNHELGPGEPGPASSPETHGLVPLPQPPQLEETDTRPAISALPGWLAHPTTVSSSGTIPLDSLGVNSITLASLKQKGYQDAFAIQATILHLLLPGVQQYDGDICISAVTGSGKTLAYALPLVENLRDRPAVRLRGLIVVPTRELVAQVRECLELCCTGSGLKIGTAIGSKSLKEEQELLVEKGWRYDPDAYRAENDKTRDEEEELMDWDFEKFVVNESKLEGLTNYVVDYTSKVDILICTPGRLVDHINSTKGFTLSHVQWLVIDEADRLLDGNFQHWVEIVMPALEYQVPLSPIDEQLFKTFHLLRQRKVRKVILSATMTRDISQLMALRLRRPKMVVLKTTETKDDDSLRTTPKEALSDSQTIIELPPTLQEIAIPISNAEEKPLHLIALLEQENIMPAFLRQLTTKSHELEQESSTDSDETSDSSTSPPSSSSAPSKPTTSKPEAHPPTHGILIFTSNNENALRLARLLGLLRPPWCSHISTLTNSTSSARARKTLAAFRSHKLAVLVASDRAARGLDIPALAHVINYDVPGSVRAYVHRVGRTARAGCEGRATTLVAHREARWFWNEIARGKGVRRGGERKVVREESQLEIVGEEERKEYKDALRRLGEEARGKADWGH